MKKRWISLGALVLGLVILVTIGFVVGNYYKDKHEASRQAVFLTNGQVYFGYVDNPSAQIVQLHEIYYLKTQDLLQPNADQNGNNKISLVKLGNELHGPTDEMSINRDQILFIESMKLDSKINQAINKFNDQNSEQGS